MPTSQAIKFAGSISDKSPVLCDFEVGDFVTVTNAYGVKFYGRRVIGFLPKINPDFLPENFIHLNWDCYWYPVKASALELERKAEAVDGSPAPEKILLEAL